MASKKPEAFTDRENEKLRELLKQWRRKAKLSQEKAGDVLGIGQQSVGTLEKGGGFSRPTALALAQTQGYESAEALLEVMGVLASRREEYPWRERELAFGAARRVGYDERVLARVAERYSEGGFVTRSPKWWMERIVNMAQEFEAEVDVKERARTKSTPPPPESSALATKDASSARREKREKRRRKAG